jgi:Cys-tRNA(Pro)/Cys-tRNA(Cys) deacylase
MAKKKALRQAQGAERQAQGAGSQAQGVERQARGAGGTPATVALTKAGIGFTLHPYEHHEGAASFGDEAVAALGVEPTRIFKTLVADLGAELVVAVVPVAQQLDLKALAAALGAKKAVMADPAAAARSSGYVVGGISPIGQRVRLRAVLDSSVEQFPTVYVSAGRRGLQVELSPADLIRITGARTAAIGH